ncbi:MAG TPA: NUDIX hydrolase [Gaiellales bacterium]
MRDWRICPRCAAALRHGPVAGEDIPRLHCTACGLVLYENPAPTVSAVVERDGLVLLTRRGIEPRLGMWDTPGGFVEAGEEPVEALRRELLEETGLTIEVGELLGIYPDRYDDGVPTLNVFYVARVTAGGDGEPRDDVTEIGWFEPHALPQLAFGNGERALAEWRLWRAARSATNL